MKFQPGEHIGLRWEDGLPEFEVIKGTVELDEFRRVMLAEDDEVVIERIEHKFGRFSVGYIDAERCQVFEVYDERGRGRFPVTLGYRAAV